MLTLSQLRKMKVDDLLDLAQANGIFVWYDSTRQDIFDAVKLKLIDGDTTIWCT